MRAKAGRAMALFCMGSVACLIYLDSFLLPWRETEVWLGFELHGAWARATAPLHWALFAFGAWAFWRERPWVWRAAAAYCGYVAFSHGVWNFVSPNGGGAFAAAWQFVLFLAPAPLLLWLAPPTDAPRSV